MAVSSTSGQGRKPGVPNKATQDIKALAQEHGPAAIRELVRLAHDAKAEQTRVAAIKELLDRGYGRASQAITGADGGEIITRVIYGWGDPE